MWRENARQRKDVERQDSFRRSQQVSRVDEAVREDTASSARGARMETADDRADGASCSGSAVSTDTGSSTEEG